jgi:NADPH:quinone reductase-like Zn-dependent oxidoreductase
MGMKAIVLNKGGPPEVLRLEELPDPVPAAGQARVRLRAAGLNHRDVWQRVGYPGPLPMILGSDGAGVVDAVSDRADEGWLGQEVAINPGLHWGDREDCHAHGFEILGNPTRGTYAEAVLVPVANLAPKPEHLDFLQAAALPLAGLTAWRALFTQGALAPGQTVLLPGIGGGVAGLALLLAKAAGARVIVTTGSEDKLKRALAQGADFAVNYTDSDWEGQVREFAREEGIDLVIDHSGEKTLPAAVRLVRGGGRIVFLGVTTGTELRLNIRDLFFRQVRLIGTYMGSPREFADLLRFVRLHRLAWEVNHVFALAEAAKAHTLMESSGQYGKILLRI